MTCALLLLVLPLSARQQQRMAGAGSGTAAAAAAGLVHPPYHLALHCFADLRTSNEEIRDHWLSPYFMTAALRISSCKHTTRVNLSSSDRGVLVVHAARSDLTSVFFQIPPLIMILILALFS